MDHGSIERIDIQNIFRRRKWTIIITTFIFVIAALIIGLKLRPVYQSTATILIEDNEVPSEFTSTLDSYVEQRIQYINQRIMTTTRLLEIIQRLNLYEDLRDKEPADVIIEKFRNDVTLKPLSFEVVKRQKFTSVKAGTIAFTLSYEGENPSKVQEVAKWLASIFIEENRSERLQSKVNAMSFMDNETENLKSELQQLEAKISAFKQAHINELPETLPSNMQTLSIVERSIDVTNQRLRGLKEREEYLRDQLTGIDPHIEKVSIRQQLTDMNLRLLQMSKRYSDEYPDIKKLRSEIADLESQLTGAAPGVKQSPPDNPTYIRLSAELAGIRSEIRSFQNELRQLQVNADIYRKRIADSPKLEEPYNNLITARNNIQLKYNEMVRESMNAKLSYGAEKAEIGERFTLLEPPELPIEPIKPNRRLIVLIGFLLGVINGIGLSAFREFIDDSVWDPAKLELMTSFPVFANIPEFSVKAQLVKKRRIRLTVTAGILLSVVSLIAAFHFFNYDFITFWNK